MRLSTYTRIIDLRNGSSLLLNLPLRIADIVPTEHACALGEQSGPAGEDALIDYGLRAGYLTTLSPEDELSWFQDYVRSHLSVAQAANVSVVTTNACNLACSYCFQADTGMRSISQRYISMAEAASVVDGLKTLQSSRGVDHLELFGGEPLLPRTAEVVHYLVRSAAELGLHSRATTNGVYLDKFTDILVPGLLDDLQISLDGPAELHDQRRIPRSGQPTYDRIVANIGSAVAAGVHVLIRVNLDKRNIDSLPVLLEQLQQRQLWPHPNTDLQFVNVHSDPLAPDRGVGDHFMSMAEINEFLERLAAESPATDIIPVSSQSPLGEYLRMLMSQPMFDACGAPSRNVYFSPEGAVYNCHELVGRPDRAVGSFSSGTIIELPIWDVWRERRVDRLENCRQCNLALAHGGGCGARLPAAELGRWGVCGGFPDEFDARIVALANRS